MIPSYIWLAGLSAIFLAGFSILVKIMVRYRICDSGLVTWGTASATGIISILIWLFFLFPFPAKIILPFFATGFFVLFGHFIINKAMQEGDPSTVVPLLSLKLPFVAILSYLILNESHSPKIYFGVLLAAIGVIFFGIGKQEKAKGSHEKHPMLAIILAIAATLMYSLADQFGKICMSTISSLSLTLWINIIGGSIGGIILCRPYYRIYKITKLDLFLFFLTGLMMFLGMIFTFMAFQHADGVTLPNIIQSTRGFIALLIGIILAKTLKIPFEQQSPTIYLFRFIGTIVLFSAVIIVLI